MNGKYRASPTLKEWLDWLRPMVPSWSLHPATFAALYAVIGLGTFGHVAADNWRADQYDYAQCDRVRTANPASAYNYCRRPDAFSAGMSGMAAGLGWPLYLSWKVQQ